MRARAEQPPPMMGPMMAAGDVDLDKAIALAGCAPFATAATVPSAGYTISGTVAEGYEEVKEAFASSAFGSARLSFVLLLTDAAARRLRRGARAQLAAVHLQGRQARRRPVGGTMPSPRRRSRATTATRCRSSTAQPKRSPPPCLRWPPTRACSSTTTPWPRSGPSSPRTASRA